MNVPRFSVLAVLLLTAGFVFGQQPPAKRELPAAKEPAKPAPGSLEDTLNKALQNSADIKAAEAKVREAEAQLNQVRQQVLTKATGFHTDLNLAKRMLAVAEQALAMQEQLIKKGMAAHDGLLTAQAMVEKHRGEVEKLQTELKSLRGEFAVSAGSGLRSVAFAPDGNFLAATGADGIVRLWDVTTGAAVPNDLHAYARWAWTAKAPDVPASMTDRVKKLLDQEVQFSAGQNSVEEALRMLLNSANADISLHSLLGPKGGAPSVTLKGKMTVGACIQAIEDTDPEVRVLVRDYGLLLTTRDKTPEGALRVQDVWKGNYAPSKKAEPKAPVKN